MNLETLRHSASHVMAAAVKRLFPEAKLGIGPSIEDGFYYDFDIPGRTLVPEDLFLIEKEMKKIIDSDQKFEKIELSKTEAEKILKENSEKYKLELLSEIPDEKITFYKNGDFMDMCRGPHIQSTGELLAFKLLTIAGAYWRGNEKNNMLQRIYGIAFLDDVALNSHLARLEEAIKRDHRKLGQELDLFHLYHEEAGPGLVYYHPKGAQLRFTIEEFLKKEHKKRGYQFVIIPHIAKIDLWNTSGHTSYYKENMFFLEIEKQKYVLKPMNCPGHILIYKNKLRSYRELPIRFFELGTVYRYERSGVLHGLLRVRGFTQDDAHIFCSEEELHEEILKVIDFAFEMLRIFGFEYEVVLSTRPDEFSGTEENWKHATDALVQALKSKDRAYKIDEGAGVFYGPKIDIKMKDALGRAWQGPTIQVDFNLPERFDLTYSAADGKKKRPVMIHRVVLGSMERFIGALIENYGGAFPLWLSPVQVKILPIADRHIDYAKKIKEKLEAEDRRVEIDNSSEKIGAKIRKAQLEKVPYMIIIGDKEVESEKIALRSRTEGDLGARQIHEFALLLKTEIDKRQ